MNHTEFKKAIETTLGQPLRAHVIGERKHVGPFTRDYTVFNLKKGYCQVSCESTDYSIGIYLWGFGETPLPDGVSPDGHWNIGLRTDGPEQAEANLKTLARRLAQIGYTPPAAPDEDFVAAFRKEIGSLTLEEVRDVLFKLDPDCGYDQWIRVARVLKERFPVEYDSVRALALFDEWSSKGSKYREGEPGFKWASIRPFPPDAPEAPVKQGEPAAGLSAELQKFIDETPPLTRNELERLREAVEANGFFPKGPVPGLLGDRLTAFKNLIASVRDCTRQDGGLRVFTLVSGSSVCTVRELEDAHKAYEAICAELDGEAEDLGIPLAGISLSPEPDVGLSDRDVIGECTDAICKAMELVLEGHGVKYAPDQSKETLRSWITMVADHYVAKARPEAEQDAGLSGDIYSEAAEVLGVPRSEAKQAILDMLARVDVEKNGFPGKKLIEAAREFVAKVDRGEARSRRSYAAFKEALAELDSCKPAAGLSFTENQKHILRDALNNYVLDIVAKGRGGSPAAVNARDLISKFQ